jgi:hypothetical protein
MAGSGEPGAALDEGGILAEARARAGLEDFGDESFRAGLSRLLASLEREARLSPAGRAAQRERAIGLLVNRLRAQQHFARHPEILEQRIEAPLFVVGLARTGTTLLHRLLASDPGLSAVLWWECRSPAPFPGARPGEPDPRIADAESQVKLILETAPVLASIHPWDARGPDEEILLMEHSFWSHVPESGANVPSYRAWVDASDPRPAYAYLKRLLQFLQWQKRRAGRAGERSVLKSPCHLAAIEVLFETFPDARVVQTHRDPLETIPSVASMYRALWSLASDEVDPREVGRQCADRYGRALRHCLDHRARRGDGRFLDVWYEDVLRDPLAEVRRIHAFLGRALGPAAERAMRAWLAANPREGRGAHAYSAAEFGLTRAGLERDFASYRERFILPRARAAASSGSGA